MSSESIIDPIHDSHRERDILARYMYSFMLFIMFALARFGPSYTPAAMLYNAPDGFGRFLIAAAGVLAALLCGDTLINDSMPPRYQLKWTSRHRHLLCVAGALVFMCAVYHTAVVPGPTLQTLVVVLMYAGLAGFGMGIAWRDVRRRPGHILHGV